MTNNIFKAPHITIPGLNHSFLSSFENSHVVTYHLLWDLLPFLAQLGHERVYTKVWPSTDFALQD